MAGLLGFFGVHPILGQSIPVPEYYGVYVVSNGHLLKLDGKVFHADKNVTVRFGQRNGVGNVVSHQPAALPPVNIPVPTFPADLKIVIYAESTAVQSPMDIAKSIHITPMVFVRNYSVDTGMPNNIRRTDAENGWDDGSPSELVMANMGDRAQELELLVKPMPGQKDMVVAGLAENLSPGVYRIRQGESDSMAAMMGGGGKGLAFAVEPLPQGEADKCVNQSISYMMTMSKTKYTACDGSPSPDAASGGSSGVAAADSAPAPGGATPCSDYDTCMKTGFAFEVAKNWGDARRNYLAGAKMRPSSGVPWQHLGTILLMDGETHRVEELASVWDKALSLGATAPIAVCHERGLQPCERGELLLRTKTVSLRGSGTQELFASAPAGIVPGKLLNNSPQAHIAYSMKVGGKNYALDFIPFGAHCTYNLMVQCSADGMAQQLLLAQYVAQTLPKLVSGALAAAPETAAPAPNPPSAGPGQGSQPLNGAQNGAATGSPASPSDSAPHAINMKPDMLQPDTILIQTDSGLIRVNNFFRKSKGKTEDGGVLLETAPTYIISFNSEMLCGDGSNPREGCFSIVLSDKGWAPPDRLRAEQFLMGLLGVSKPDFCRLPISDVFLESSVEGTHGTLPPSFCPNGEP